MIGFLKGLTKGMQDRTLASAAMQGSRESRVTPGVMGRSEKNFCDPKSVKPCITVCSPRGACECHCENVRQAITEELKLRGMDLPVGEAKFGCSGKCSKGPFIGFPQRGFFYEGVSAADAPEIVEETLLNGKILFPLLSISSDRAYRDDFYYDKGTGLLGVIDGNICMVEAAKYFLDFERDLSCGKCVPCRIGIKRMQEGVERILTGTGIPEDLEQIISLCKTLIDTPHCEFAAVSSRPVLSAVTFFEDEFRAHAERMECLTGVCEGVLAPQRKLAAQRKVEEEAQAAEKAKLAERERVLKAEAEAQAKAEEKAKAEEMAKKGVAESAEIAAAEEAGSPEKLEIPAGIEAAKEKEGAEKEEPVPVETAADNLEKVPQVAEPVEPAQVPGETVSSDSPAVGDAAQEPEKPAESSARSGSSKSEKNKGTFKKKGGSKSSKGKKK